MFPNWFSLLFIALCMCVPAEAGFKTLCRSLLENSFHRPKSSTVGDLTFTTIKGADDIDLSPSGTSARISGNKSGIFEGSWRSITFAAGTDLGKGWRYGKNQDGLVVALASNKTKLLLSVIDGMGGHKGGEIASDVIARSLEEDLETDFYSSLEALNRTPRALQNRAQVLGNRIWPFSKKVNNMGAAVAAVEISPSTLTSMHAGDSRTMLIRNGKIFFITPEHTYRNELINRGMPASKAIGHKDQEKLVRAVRIQSGGPILPNFEVRPVKSFIAGDRVLSASDALWKVLSLDEILEIASSESAPTSLEVYTRLRRALRTATKEHSQDDNVSIIVIFKNE